MNQRIQEYIQKCSKNAPADPKNIEAITSHIGAKLPESYLELLEITDGFEGKVSNDDYVVFFPTAEVISANVNRLKSLLIVGSDGAEENIGIDFREDSQTYGHYFLIRDDSLNWEDARYLGQNIEDIKIINPKYDGYKSIGTVRVPVLKEPALDIKISKAVKEKLNIDFDKTKHAYYYKPEKPWLLGSVLYEIFEKTE